MELTYRTKALAGVFKLVMKDEDREIKQLYWFTEKDGEMIRLDGLDNLCDNPSNFDLFIEHGLFQYLSYSYHPYRFYPDEPYDALLLYWAMSLSEEIEILEEKDVPELSPVPDGCIA